MTFLELLRKYDGQIVLASSAEIQHAWFLANKSGRSMASALEEARKDYKRAVINSIKSQ